MLRRAACSLLGPLERGLAQLSASQLQQVQFYSQPPPADYAIAMRKAQELSNSLSALTPEKEIGLCAGNPLETYKRPARIFVSARSPSQSGMGKTLSISNHAPQWRIAFDTTGKWENQLIGWTSTGDPLENVGRASLFFYTKDEAIAFCQKYGWEYTVDTPNERRTTRPKRYNSYGDNFSTKMRNGIPNLSHMASHATYEP